MELSQKLKELRKKQGLTQLELAERLFVSRQAISGWEAGTSRPSTENLQSLSRLFNIPLETLLDDTAEAEPAAAPVPFPVSWTVKMKKKQKETQDILSYHTQAAGCSDKARAKASGGRQPIEECGRTGL